MEALVEGAVAVSAAKPNPGRLLSHTFHRSNDRLETLGTAFAALTVLLRNDGSCAGILICKWGIPIPLFADC